ncbi:MAG: glycosyltransferase family 2 protein [Clostridia bacterium]|nr:glycosyltransferase family 2 protein [Clostridia bacterium]
MSAMVSVIIPVYNLEDYIEHCIKSILSQTYKNIEVICVDDGSTDSSAQVIGELLKSDSRIRYIYQENAGVSAARNKGLESARGEYIMFIDGDDYMHNQAVEILVKCIEENDYGMVSGHQKSTYELDEEMPLIESYDCHDASHEELFKTVNGNVIGKSSCAKLFKREDALKARFPVGIANGEDANYIIRLLATGMKTAIVDLTLYYYYTRENSSVTSGFSESKFSITLSFDDLCEFLRDSECSFLRAYCLQYLYQTIFYNRTNSIGTPAQKYVMRESKRIGDKWLEDFKNNDDIDAKIKKLFIPFFKSRHLYEFARMVKDPTMIIFYITRPFKKFRRKD